MYLAMAGELQARCTAGASSGWMGRSAHLVRVIRGGGRDSSRGEVSSAVVSGCDIVSSGMCRSL